MHLFGLLSTTGLTILLNVCDDNIVRFTYPSGAVLNKKLHLASHQKDIFMKIFLYLIGIGFAFVFSVSVNAKASSGEIMTRCKSNVKESVDDVARIRTSKYKEKASGTMITFRVSSSNNQTKKVTCTYANGVATLADPIKFASSKIQ